MDIHPIKVPHNSKAVDDHFHQSIPSLYFTISNFHFEAICLSIGLFLRSDS